MFSMGAISPFLPRVTSKEPLKLWHDPGSKYPVSVYIANVNLVFTSNSKAKSSTSRVFCFFSALKRINYSDVENGAGSMIVGTISLGAYLLPSGILGGGLSLPLPLSGSST
jgi:hypothetical protein